jgi:hypothetical protein
VVESILLFEKTFAIFAVKYLHLQKNINYGFKSILVGYFISSIIFIVVSLFTANTYTIDFVLNGVKEISFGF